MLDVKFIRVLVNYYFLGGIIFDKFFIETFTESSVMTLRRKPIASA